MALRTLTPEGAFCANCAASVDSRAELCLGCGQPLTGETTGVRCPGCGQIATEGESACPSCGEALPSVADAFEGQILERMKELREHDRRDTVRLERVPTALPEDSDANLLAEFESLWKLSEPFEQVVASRRKRLQQMDRLIASARRRIRELDRSLAPAEVRERQELKKQLQQVLLERDEILKIEYGITEMERIYRNIITMQQKELRTKEDSLKARLEGFRRELEMRDKEREAFETRSKALAEREEELEARLAEFDAWTREFLASAPKGSGDTPDSREKWLEAQKQIQQSLLKLRSADGEIDLSASAPTIRDLRVRVSELEEGMEKVVEEKQRLERELAAVREAEGEVREVMKVLDDLLGQLPDEHVRRFARSEGYRRYERLMERIGV